MKVTCPRCRNKFEISSNIETDLNKDIVTIFRQIGEIQEAHKQLEETIKAYKNNSNNRNSPKNIELDKPKIVEDLSTKMDDLLESSKRSLNSTIESLFDLKNTLKNSKPATQDDRMSSNLLAVKLDKKRSKSSEKLLFNDTEIPKAPKFTYSNEQQRKIGRPLEEGPEWGPLEYLSDEGDFKFKIADHHSDRWNDIVHKRDVMIANRSLLLPQELSGLIVWLSVKGVQPSHPADEFKLRLFVPTLKHNEGIKLPVNVSIQLKMELINGEIFTSAIHKFEIKKLNVFCEPDNFFIPFKNTRKTKLPKFIIKFSI